MGFQVRQVTTAWLMVFLCLVLTLTMVIACSWRPVTLRRIKPVQTGTRIDVNIADADTLCLLPRFGPRLASATVRRREQVGGFSSVDDLQQVSGIGPAVLAGIRPLVVCGQETCERVGCR